MSQVRVRFAPSPTGFFHIGSARTALFNWLYARHTGGTFILRIEDTDKERNSEAFLNLIYDSLTWLGLNWDEGPKVGKNGGGDFGPYRQSERSQIYKDHVAKLMAAGRAYEKDGAIWFKLLGERYKIFDDHRKKEVEKVKVPPVVIEDRIRGRVERMEDEDFVIVRSDGNPVFHLVNVVDDIAMKVTHIIRGEDHLSNTSKHVLLYEGFGVKPPEFAHIPLILKEPGTGQGKMSKRDKGALIEEYQRRHFLPEAIVNYLALLGWNPGDDREKMPIAEIVRLFDLPGVNQSNAKFDGKKLAHMNMIYLQELNAERFTERAKEHFRSAVAAVEKILEDHKNGKDPYLLPETRAQTEPIWVRRKKYLEEALRDDKASYFADVMKLCQPKMKSIDELVSVERLPDIDKMLSYTEYFFTEDFPVDSDVKKKVLAKGEPKARLAELVDFAKTADFASEATLTDALKKLAEGKGLGFGDYQAVARLAVTGTNVGPSITGIFSVLGRERTVRRLEKFLAGSG